MDLPLKRINWGGSFLHIYKNDPLVLGFSEKDATLEDISSYVKPKEIKQLKQIHSNKIHLANDINEYSQGDGIILEETDIMAVIKTADCVPLFFWDKTFSIGGILHIGWQGLCQGIEKKMIAVLRQKRIPLEALNFFLGPAIEQKCYEVDQARFNCLKDKTYQNKIFRPSGSKKFQMDIPGGIILSLKEAGISEKQVFKSNLCTFCNSSFPSYRRDRQTGQRIYSFFLIRRAFSLNKI